MPACRTLACSIIFDASAHRQWVFVEPRVGVVVVLLTDASRLFQCLHTPPAWGPRKSSPETLNLFHHLCAGVELVGVFVVANRVGGYEAGLVEDLAPMAEAVALALQGLNFRQQLAEASRLALILLKVHLHCNEGSVLCGAQPK